MCSLCFIYLLVVLFKAYHIISQVVKIMYSLFCTEFPSVIYKYIIYMYMCCLDFNDSKPYLLYISYTA